MSDFYTYLGVSDNASAADIRQAYRKRAKELHPDLNRSPGAEAEFKALQHAFEVLMDPARRRDYDRSRDPVYGRTVGARPTPPGPPNPLREKSEPISPAQRSSSDSTDERDRAPNGNLVAVAFGGLGIAVVLAGLWIAAGENSEQTPRVIRQGTTRVNDYGLEMQSHQPSLPSDVLEFDRAARGPLEMVDYYGYDGRIVLTALEEERLRLLQLSELLDALQSRSSLGPGYNYVPGDLDKAGAAGYDVDDFAPLAAEYNARRVRYYRAARQLGLHESIATPIPLRP